MIISFHREFTKRFKKLSVQQKRKFKERVALFAEDPFDPTLNNHALRGTYRGYRSINVTGDLRAIYKSDGDNALFVAIDSHSNLYG